MAPALQWVAELRARQHEQQALAEAAAALSAALENRAGRAQLEALSVRVRQLHGAEDPQVARLLQRCAQQREVLRQAARRQFAFVAAAVGVGPWLLWQYAHGIHAVGYTRRTRALYQSLKVVRGYWIYTSILCTIAAIGQIMVAAIGLAMTSDTIGVFLSSGQ